MKWILIPILLMTACSAIEQEGSLRSNATAPTALNDRSDIDVDGFAAQHDVGAKVIDVRTPEEFALGHVPGALNIPLDVLDPRKPPIADWQKTDPIYLICRSGKRSALAADQVASAGYQAINVEGGTLAWRNRGFPLE